MKASRLSKRRRHATPLANAAGGVFVATSNETDDLFNTLAPQADAAKEDLSDTAKLRLAKPVDILLDTVKTPSRLNRRLSDDAVTEKGSNNYEVYQNSRNNFTKELVGSTLDTLLLKPYTGKQQKSAAQPMMRKSPQAQSVHLSSTLPANLQNQAAKPHVKEPNAPVLATPAFGAPANINFAANIATATDVVRRKQQGAAVAGNGSVAAINAAVAASTPAGSNVPATNMNSNATSIDDLTANELAALLQAQTDIPQLKKSLNVTPATLPLTLLDEQSPKPMEQLAELENLALNEVAIYPKLELEEHRISRQQHLLPQGVEIYRNSPNLDNNFTSVLNAQIDSQSLKSGTEELSTTRAVAPQVINFSERPRAETLFASQPSTLAKSIVNLAPLEGISPTAAETTNEVIAATNTSNEDFLSRLFNIDDILAPAAAPATTVAQVSATEHTETVTPDTASEKPPATTNTITAPASTVAPVRIERVFEEMEDDLLLYTHDSPPARFSWQKSAHTWKAACLNLLSSCKQLFPLLNNTKLSPNNYARLSNKERLELLQSRRKNIFTSWLLLLALFHLAALLLWVFIPGSFLNIYKTQISGYVFNIAWRFCLVLAIPTYWCWRKFRMQAYELAVYLYKAPFKLPQFTLSLLVGLSSAFLVNACNRLLVINVYSNFKQSITEVDFLLPPAGNLQSWFLIVLIGCFITAISESLFLQGFFLGNLMASRQSLWALLLQCLLAPVFYTNEYDFISLIICFICFGRLRQVYDNLASVIAANFTCKLTLLLLRVYLPFLHSRSLFSPNSGQAFLLVDCLLIVIAAVVLVLLYRTLAAQFPSTTLEAINTLLLSANSERQASSSSDHPSQGGKNAQVQAADSKLKVKLSKQLLNAKEQTAKQRNKNQSLVAIFSLFYEHFVQDNWNAWRNFFNKKLLIAYVLIWLSYFIVSRL